MRFILIYGSHSIYLLGFGYSTVLIWSTVVCLSVPCFGCLIITICSIASIFSKVNFSTGIISTRTASYCPISDKFHYPVVTHAWLSESSGKLFCVLCVTIIIVWNILCASNRYTNSKIKNAICLKVFILPRTPFLYTFNYIGIHTQIPHALND